MTFVALAFAGISTFCIYKFLRGIWAVNFTPGPRPLFSPLSPFGAVLPATFLNPGSNWAWTYRRTAYFNRTYDMIAFVPWLIGNPTYYSSSMDVMRQLLGSESRLHLEKPQDLTLARLWGHSVTSANGDVWRRHRRVVSPAFNNKTYEDVWRNVKVVYQEMLNEEGWQQKEEVFFSEINSLVLKFTFIIICRCGFGFTSSWSSTAENFPEALRLVSETLIPRIVIPNWAYKLPFERLRRMNDTWLIVASTISDLIEKRKSDNLGSSADNLPTDILNCLVTSWIVGEKNGIDEHELVANMFSLMFAGHETTSSGIVSTLGYLALYPDEQEKVYREICNAFSEHDPSELLDASKIPLTLYSFWEAQRLCPSAVFIPRQLSEGTIVNVVRPNPERMHLKKGSLVMFDLVGILRNPNTFPDPEVFRTERWTNVSEHDVGAFGFGPRACIGRKFSQTEALAFLSSLLYDWKVEPNLLPGESRDQYEERVMGNAALNGTAFGFKSVPLRLSKRRIESTVSK